MTSGRGLRRPAAVAQATAVVSAAVLAMLVNPPGAAAADCPDVNVVFARGTGEPPGEGVIGRAFIDALRADTPKSIDVYPVNYPASPDYPTGVEGVVDAGNHVREMAANCPNTRIVLGGYSQGAGVMALLTSDGNTAGPADLPAPLPPELSDRIAAVALFGKPSAELVHALGMSPVTVGAAYAGKTIELCADGDPICDTDQGNSIVPHLLYAVNGMTAQAADFAAQRL